MVEKIRTTITEHYLPCSRLLHTLRISLHISIPNLGKFLMFFHKGIIQNAVIKMN